MPTAPKTQPQWAQFLYDARSPTYDASFHPSFATRMVDRLSPPPGAHVLDLAAGTGLVSYAAASRVAPTGSVAAVDASAGMLAVARAKLPAFLAALPRDARGADLVRFHQHDIADLETLDAVRARKGAFDAVMCCSALVLLDDPAAAVAAWAAYLRPGGRILLDVPREDSQRGMAVLEAAARRLGLGVGYNRAWVTGPEALRRVVEAGGGLRVEWLEVVEQRGGEGAVYTRGEEDARELFEAGVGVFDLQREEDVERLRGEFTREWMALWEAEGREVRDVDGVYVAVARRV